MSDDAELLRLYAEERSEAAFAELVRRHLDLVYSAALRQVGGDAHRAHDVAQTVFTVLARKATAVARHPVLVGWLYTSTQHAAAKVRRSEARRRAREHEAQFMNGGEAGDSSAVEWEKLSPLLDEAMRELNERDREAVLLRFFARRPFAEIGATLRVSEDAARMRVERALEKLRGLLARRGVTSTGAALGVVLANQAVMAAPVGLAGTVVGAATAAGTLVAGGVGGGSGIWSQSFTFMSTAKITVGVAIVCAAVGLGSAVYQAGEVTRANEAVAAMQRERAAAEAKAVALTAQVREGEASARTAAERMAALEGQLAAAKKTGSGAATNAAPAAPRVSSPDLIWTNPAYARAYVEKYRAGLGLRFGPLYRALNLSPEQIAKFESTLTEGQQGVVDVWAEAGKQGLSTSGDSATSTGVARLTSGPLGNMEKGLKELLGEAGFENYKQFDKARGNRELITSLAGGLYSSETPLTAVQGEALAAVLASNTRTEKIPMADDGKKQMYRILEVTDWAEVQKQAQGILSAPQLAALKALNDQKQLDQEMARARGAAANAAAAKSAAGGGK